MISKNNQFRAALAALMFGLPFMLSAQCEQSPSLETSQHYTSGFKEGTFPIPDYGGHNVPVTVTDALACFPVAATTTRATEFDGNTGLPNIGSICTVTYNQGSRTLNPPIVPADYPTAAATGNGQTVLYSNPIICVYECIRE